MLETLSISLAIIFVAAALVHGSYQLSIAMLTALSSHTIGKRKSYRTQLSLTSAFIAGALTVTLLVVAGVSQLQQAYPAAPYLGGAYALVAGLMTIGFYYRDTKGTILWVPRDIVAALTGLAKKTTSFGQAFGLGTMTAIVDLPFVIAPILLATGAYAQVGNDSQLFYGSIYTLLALSPLLFVFLLISSGRKISLIQRWREEHKRFVQIMAGCTLLLAGTLALVIHSAGSQA